MVQKEIRGGGKDRSRAEIVEKSCKKEMKIKDLFYIPRYVYHVYVYNV